MTSYFRVLSVLALAFVLLGSGSQAQAAGGEFWVDATGGSDTNTGTPDDPFETVGAAVAAAQADEGGTVFLKAGEYEEGRLVVREEDEGSISILVLPATDGEATLADQYFGTSLDGNVFIDIPTGTGIEGDDSWMGSLLPVTMRDITLSLPGFHATTSVAATIGAWDAALSLSAPARIVFEGEEGKKAGFFDNGSFSEITATCTENENPQDYFFDIYLLPEGATDCKTDIAGENDLYVWTTHLSTFVTYEAEEIVAPEPEVEPAPEPVISEEPRRRGGGGRSGQKVIPPVPQGEVLGASTYVFSSDLEPGVTSEEVKMLQSALIAAGYSLPSGATGFYGRETYAAVAAYQTSHGISPASGRFGPLTRASMNAGDTRAALITQLLMKVRELQEKLDAMEA